MQTKYFILLLAISFGLWSCGGSSDKNAETQSEPQQEESTTTTSSSEDSPNNLSEAMKQVQEAAQKLQGGDGKAVESVDFRKLKDLLPQSIAGLDRKNASGERNGVKGLTVSMAEGEYGSGDQTAKVVITDVGGNSFALMGMAAWATLDIDKEDENGYERTTTLDGHKGLERYNNKSKSGELNLLVGNRYIITVKTEGLAADRLQKAISAIDLKELESLK